jgi:hypothetical protein
MEQDKLKYVVVGGQSSASLTKTVNEYIENGWKPIGSHQVSVESVELQHAKTYHKYTLRYSQTLIRD